jgi:hypothetical protein
LSHSTFFGAISLTDLAAQNGFAHLLLGMVVIRAYAIVVQEGKQLIPVTTQPFDEPFYVLQTQQEVSGGISFELAVRPAPLPSLAQLQGDITCAPGCSGARRYVRHITTA